MIGFYLVTRETSPPFGFDTTSHWNRKRGLFQPYLCKNCVYPTNKGAARTAEKLSLDHINVQFTIEEAA